jgi:hypothetical protein
MDCHRGRDRCSASGRDSRVGVLVSAGDEWVCHGTRAAQLARPSNRNPGHSRGGCRRKWASDQRSPVGERRAGSRQRHHRVRMQCVAGGDRRQHLFLLTQRGRGRCVLAVGAADFVVSRRPLGQGGCAGWLTPTRFPMCIRPPHRCHLRCSLPTAPDAACATGARGERATTAWWAPTVVRTNPRPSSSPRRPSPVRRQLTDRRPCGLSRLVRSVPATRTCRLRKHAR